MAGRPGTSSPPLTAPPFKNLGYERVADHEERYDRADEYMEVCYRLWDSWDEDAVVMDVERDMFADPAKVHELNFQGKWFKCRGPLNVPRSPQGKPVIAQAGQSHRGLEFAARHGEMIFAIQPFLDGMKQYHDDFKARMRNYDREPEEAKVLFGIIPIIGETEEIAKAKAAFSNSLVSPEAGLVQLSAITGFDLSTANLDDLLTSLPPIPNVRGMVDAYTRTVEGRKATIRDMAMDIARGISVPHVVGTPEQVADWMEETMETVGGDGFMVSSTHLPGSIEEFAGLVVPILQEAGSGSHGIYGRNITG